MRNFSKNEAEFRFAAKLKMIKVSRIIPLSNIALNKIEIGAYLGSVSDFLTGHLCVVKIPGQLPYLSSIELNDSEEKLIYH